MHVRATRTEGLGNSSYLLSHGGVSVLVDPQRDYERFLDGADAVTVGFVLETHIHNDYVSGGRPAAKATGADLVLPAGAAVEFAFRPAFNLEDIDAGPLRIRPIHTPGHTPEHISYLIVVDDEPAALFSGGSLLVGSAGRTDLLGEHLADQMARLQFASLDRLAHLPAKTPVYPTHGEGSFCATSGAGRHESTIGDEVRSNPALQHSNPDSFVTEQLSGLQPYPRYYARMAPINRRGPTPMGSNSLPELQVEDVRRHSGSIVDIRDRHSFASGHLPASLGIEYSDQFASWAGWILDPSRPIVLVTDTPESAEKARVDLARIGMEESLVGFFTAVDQWATDGGSLDSFRTVDTAEVQAALHQGDAPQVLDVRAPNERESEAVEGSSYRYLPDLTEGLPDDIDPEEPVWVLCGSGYRSTIAAGILEQHGFEPVVLIDAGVGDVLNG